MMNKKGILVISYIAIMVLGTICLFFSIPSSNVSDNSSLSNKNATPRQSSIPFDYYQDIEIGENYIYNVTTFGADAVWEDFSGSTSDWKCETNGQIFINFTGFFDRDPDDDEGDVFPSTDMPWMNISIFESISLLNYTNANVSNSEVSRNLKLGFADFQPGFLITVNHVDWIKANATLEANGASGIKADLTLEESYNFIYFKFLEIDGLNQEIELIYSRISGLLIRANITVGVYKLEIFLEDYTLDFETEYVYDILEFGPPGFSLYYDMWFNYIDTYALRTGSWIKINFTGYYHRDPMGEPWPGYSPYDEFYYSTPKRAWLDIKTVYNGDVYPIATMSLNNRSNQELSVAMLLGFGSFCSGYLLPEVNNQSYDMRIHAQNGANAIGNTLSYTETDLTIKLDCKHTKSSYFPQDTYLIYEKYTGLLLFADTKIEGYNLKMIIEDYIFSEENKIIDDDDDDDDDEKTNSQQIPSFPLVVFLSIFSITTLIIISRMKKYLN